ncbi:MAG: NnrS family protein [Pseudomonadales bacterium]|nr:NnrS family protein [Halioglobus sp.]MCP5192118.1 NnrS family protein [Pseudomonadales bacterium]
MIKHRKGKTVWAHRAFFPAACLYAAIAIPLSVFAMTSGRGWPLALIGQGHGFELLFGFALAVVAGYTLGPTEPGLLAVLFACWLTGRIAHFIAPFSPGGLVLSVLFALLLAWQIVPRFVAAKKWRNRLLMPLLGGLCVLPMGYLIARQIGSPAMSGLILHEAVLFLSLLAAFMGGRVIAPAVAGELQKQGRNLEARVQPRVEAGFILLLIVAAPALAIPGGKLIAGTMGVLAGVLIWIRLLRWQLWHCRARPDLIGLAVGYAWLGCGLGLFGISVATGLHVTGALHVITIGALGTLTSSIMCRTHYQRLRRAPPPTPLVVWIIATIALATLARVAANFNAWSHSGLLLWLAAFAWTACFAVLGLLFTAELCRGWLSTQRKKA